MLGLCLISPTLEGYVAKKYNFVEGRDSFTQPIMLLARLVGALFRVFIYVGYGIECGIPGPVAEGE
jgi:hypothetical protein